MLKRRASAAPDISKDLAELLMYTVERLSQEGADIPAGCSALAGELREVNADPEQVRAIACDVIYSGNADKAEDLMGHLARYGYGPGSITARQPDVEGARETPKIPVKDAGLTPAICSTNLLAELASPDPYSALLLGDAGVGVTTLLKALIGAQLRYPCAGIALIIADMQGEADWRGIESMPNTVAQIPSRDPKFLADVADLISQVAREIQARVAQRSIKARSPSLGASRWPAYLLVINGWQHVTESLSLLSKKQISDHERAAQLLADFRYCLSTGPKVNVSTITGADRLDNCALTETALESARIFALGAVRPGGKGGYRAIDALLVNKNRLPDSRDRSRLQELLARCKAERMPVVLALSGTPRIGVFRDFRDDALNLKDLYEQRRAMK